MATGNAPPPCNALPPRGNAVAGKKFRKRPRSSTEIVRNREPNKRIISVRLTKEATMPVILLWVGIPVLLLGGGYAIVHVMH
jgi:hypothetical protein